ncbi:MAG: DNA primase [Oscillospiraceae bacterium]|nr:DNA primase [Oscillospiraceae bacterium]
MPSRFSDSFLNELTEKNDIVDVVSQYVNLSKRSGSNLFGLCPFHSERTPSFSVNRSKQIYHCFGCGKGGSVINFIMEIENVPFPDAVEVLAKRAGMQMPAAEDDPESRKRAKILAINRAAARYYYDMLGSAEGAKCREYLEKRRLSKKTATDFGLGFAPDRWDGLRNAMREKGFTDFDLFDAGLVKKSSKGSFYDVFRNRLMFPVIDVRGEVIAFSGRLLDGEGAKYMNSPETAAYSKSRNLFALNLAKKSKSDFFILSEGNIDVASLHQAGFDSAVASLGTALTEQQAQLLSRYKNEVVIAYDGDEAGIKAANKAIGIFEKLDVKVRVLRLGGNYNDPDEFLKACGPEAFRKLIEDSENRMEFKIRQIAEKYDLSRPEQKTEFAGDAEKLIAALPSKAERQIYSSVIAERIGVKPDAVMSDVENLRKRLVRRAETKETQEMISRTVSRRQYANPASARAEEGLIRLLCLDPGLIRSVQLPSADVFTDERLKKIFSLVSEKLADGEAFSVASLGPYLDSGEMSLLVGLLDEPEVLSNSERAFRDYVAAIRKASNVKSIDDIIKAKKAQEKGRK